MKKISICSVLLLVLFLIAGHGRVTMAQGKGFCDKEYHVPKEAICTDEKCSNDCKKTYGDGASGYCKTEKTPNDICNCHYPC